MNASIQCVLLVIFAVLVGLSTLSVSAFQQPRASRQTNQIRTKKVHDDLWITWNKFDYTYSSLPSALDDDPEIDDTSTSRTSAILVLMTVPLAWGTYVPVVRFLYEMKPAVPGFVFSACYYFVAAATLLSISSFKGRSNHEDRLETSDGQGESSADGDILLPIQGGIELGTYLFLGNGLQVLGLKTVASDRAGFLVQTTTIFVPIVEGILAGDIWSIPLKTWLACGLAFTGVLVMGLDSSSGDINFSPIAILRTFTVGDGLIILSALAYTLHVVRLGTYAQKTTPIKLGASKATVETILSVALVSVLCLAATSDSMESGVLYVTAKESGKEIATFFQTWSDNIGNGNIPWSKLGPAVGAVLWTGWITTAYTISAQTYGQSRVSPTEANLIYSIQPLFTATFAYLLLGETLGVAGAVGGGLIGLAVFIVANEGMILSQSVDPQETIAQVPSDEEIKVEDPFVTSIDP